MKHNYAELYISPDFVKIDFWQGLNPIGDLLCWGNFFDETIDTMMNKVLKARLRRVIFYFRKLFFDPISSLNSILDSEFSRRNSGAPKKWKLLSLS